MDKRELYDNFENMEEMSRDVQAMLASVKGDENVKIYNIKHSHQPI